MVGIAESSRRICSFVKAFFGAFSGARDFNDFQAGMRILRQKNGGEGQDRTVDTWFFRPVLYH